MGGRAGGRAGGYTCGESREELHKHAHRDDDEVDGWTGRAAGQASFRFALRSHRLLPLNQSGKGKGEGGGDLDPHWEKNAPRTNVDPEPDL